MARAMARAAGLVLCCARLRITQSSNMRALAWDLAYGFTEEGRMVGAAHDGSDSVYLVLWKKDCRWLKP